LRTNIDLDDDLIAKAMKVSGAKTKREAVHRGLEALIQHADQRKMLKFRGKVAWEGNLDELRRDR
jgi:Arc/MetJ family transcription regulator